MTNTLATVPALAPIKELVAAFEKNIDSNLDENSKLTFLFEVFNDMLPADEKLKFKLSDGKTIVDIKISLDKLIFYHIVVKTIGLNKEFNTTEECESWINNSENGNKIAFTKFDLSKRMLTSIPREISLIKNLKILNISDNFFSSVPREIFELNNLETLNMDNNFIEEIPEEIGKLSSLTSLSIEKNPIKKLPDLYALLPNLIYLYSRESF